jgi:hypothetical protein
VCQERPAFGGIRVVAVPAEDDVPAGVWARASSDPFGLLVGVCRGRGR